MARRSRRSLAALAALAGSSRAAALRYALIRYRRVSGSRSGLARRSRRSLAALAASAGPAAPPRSRMRRSETAAYPCRGPAWRGGRAGRLRPWPLRRVEPAAALRTQRSGPPRIRVEVRLGEAVAQIACGLGRFGRVEPLRRAPVGVDQRLPHIRIVVRLRRDALQCVRLN